ncbi:hypothetical protein K0M31_007963 [Melipona bicolor]|uniref:Uncharacterized protein n=1 Tax=Melipona bicolor TaxID=60889 RepID=A0AA40GCE1_9HYME|nr:hypothetical protein K0M31_007963 [Melipona bicolor]
MELFKRRIFGYSPRYQRTIRSVIFFRDRDLPSSIPSRSQRNFNSSSITKESFFQTKKKRKEKKRNPRAGEMFQQMRAEQSRGKSMLRGKENRGAWSVVTGVVRDWPSFFGVSQVYICLASRCVCETRAIQLAGVPLELT